MNNKDNLITQNDVKFILLVLSFIVGGFIWAIRLEGKVQANETKIEKYPSADWFQEKFKNVDEKFDNLTDKIDILTDLVEEDQKKN